MRLRCSVLRAALVVAVALPAFRTALAATSEPTTRPADPRWRDLPHTDTVFVPKSYQTLGQWTAWREHLRKQILWAAGLWPMPEKTPLNPQIFGRLERDGYTVEKVYFESYPGFLVTGNLYRPSPSSGKHPGVACPHGHWGKGRLAEEERGSVPARCITLARLGCVVFSYDMVGYNDSGKQIAKHGFTDERASLWGISALGLQLWNSIRVVDFLQSLPDVDADRIGCTGASGGGTQTFLLCAVDDRVKVAAPVNMISNHMQGGCVCENAPCLRFDTNNMEIGATMAPRPLLMVSATGDWTKNTPKVEFPAIREIYKLYGAEDKVATVQFQAEHNYNRDSREAVYRFFGKWLLGRDDMAEYKEPPYPKEKDEDLLVFAGRPLPAGALPNTEAVVEQCVAAAKKQLESLKHPADPDSAKQARDTLREAFRLAMGATPLTAADVGLTLAGDPGIQTGFEINRRRGTFVPVLFFRSPSAAESATAPMTILVHEKGGGQAALVAPHGRPSGEVMWKLLDAGQVVCAIDAFGTGDSVGKQDPKQPRGSTKFFTTFNRTDTAERVWDFVTVVNSFVYGAEMSGRDEVRAAGLPRATQVNLIGIGEGGAWCALACASLGMKAAGGPAVRVVIDADQIDTSSEEAYLKHLYVPGILRAGGLPAAVSLILPARLMLHNTGDRFDTSWLKDLGMPVKIVNERASDDEIVAWLTERR